MDGPDNRCVKGGYDVLVPSRCGGKVAWFDGHNSTSLLTWTCDYKFCRYLVLCKTDVVVFIVLEKSMQVWERDAAADKVGAEGIIQAVGIKTKKYY